MKKTRSLLVLFGLLFLLSDPTFARKTNSFGQKIVGYWKQDAGVLEMMGGSIDWVFNSDGTYIQTIPVLYGGTTISGNFKVSNNGKTLTMSHIQVKNSLVTVNSPATTVKLYWEDDNLLDMTHEGKEPVILRRVASQSTQQQSEIVKTMAHNQRQAATTMRNEFLIKQIQNSTMKQCPSHTVEQMVYRTMDAPLWEAVKSTDGEVFIQVNGEVNSSNEPYKMTLQFKVQDNSFSLDAVKVNSEVSADSETLNTVIKNMCERLFN